MLFKKLALLGNLFLILIFTFSCQPQLISELSPEDGIQRIRENYAKENFDNVVQDVNDYRVRHPYSQFATEALLLQADAYFKSDRYPEAIAVYEEFLQKNPNNPKKATALFRIAQCLDFQSSESEQREQDFTQRALNKYIVYLEAFASDENSNPAKIRIAKLKRRLADHDVFIARFYLKKDMYHSVISMYESILSKYTEYPDIQAECKKNLGIAYRKIADLFEKDPKSDENIHYKNTTPQALRQKASEVESRK